MSKAKMKSHRPPQCGSCRHLKALHGLPLGQCMAIGCKCPEFTYTAAKENDEIPPSDHD